MWSIYTGQEPYVWQGDLPSKNPLFPHFPSTSHPQYVHLTERCLRMDPHDRPSFVEISACLISLFQKVDASACLVPVGPPRPAPPALSVRLQEPGSPTAGSAQGQPPPQQPSSSLSDDGEVCTMWHYESRSVLGSCLLKQQGGGGGVGSKP